MSSWGTYGRTSGTGVLVVLIGIAGVVASGLLWLHEVAPTSELTRFMTEDVLGGSQGWTALIWVAGFCGVTALLISILEMIGSRRGGSLLLGFFLAVMALSYPFAYAAEVVSRPFTNVPLA
jgi:hypothetical protein